MSASARLSTRARRASLVVAALAVGASLAGCFHADPAPAGDAVADAPVPHASGPAETPRRVEGAPARENRTSLDPGLPPEADGPFVVVAHVDAGVNPYHAIFRDRSPLAYVHPSKYLLGYPPDAPALRLSLNASSFEDALRADAAVWEAVEEGTLYWIPGTRIVGAISFAFGGRSDCDALPTEPCEEYRILDEHGHGTMTASRAVGEGTSLAPTARFVSIEGLGGAGVRWAAEQGWIDVQTNSWGSLVPHPVPDAVGADIYPAFAFAASRMMVLAGSGNGLGFFAGFAPWPTYLTATGPGGVVLVGAHDNGRLTHWSGSPPHVVADGYGGLRATRNSFDEVGPSGESCCTSASSPYAAGGVAAVLLEARRLLGDPVTGAEGGIVAAGKPGLVASGPLADGKLTLEELRDLVFASATARPAEHPHDGSVHWSGEPTAPSDPTNPGGNPYCAGCATLPVEWAVVPPELPAYAFVGFGAIDEPAVARALAALGGAGAEALPAKETERRLYDADQTVRSAAFP